MTYLRTKKPRVNLYGLVSNIGKMGQELGSPLKIHARNENGSETRRLILQEKECCKHFIVFISTFLLVINIAKWRQLKNFYPILTKSLYKLILYFLYFIRFSRCGQMFRPRDKSYSQGLCSHSYEKSKAMFFTLHFSPSLLTPMTAAAACAFSTVCASLLPTVKLIGDHRLGASSKLPVQPNLVYVVFVITS